MKIQEIKDFFARFVRYKDWEFHIKEKNGVIYLQVQFMAPSTFVGDKGYPVRQFCRKWQLSEWMTKTELVRTAFLAVIQAERHEAEELFLYKGAAIFNSHLSADKLVELAYEPNSTEHRPEPPRNA